ncbi:hypothetical protein QWY14_02720 [Planococcus sp. N028]|uniref:Uncharacterized protein n=1 Tax=Planococcus shixiaomingii TaxID=3058393 RepID=A0ABT8MZ01_9BACL|nr:hypothetical protein [Planococcus sp. N028]MDN7240682.1 hypothetical protein [Planococcus sp. N028]
MAIGIVLYVGMLLQVQIVEWSHSTFYLFPLQVYIALFPVIIGLLIRTPKYILEMKNRQPMVFDWIIFSAIGLPALYIVLMTFLPFSPLGAGWLSVPRILLLGGTTVPTIAGLVFGYIVLDSFKVKNASK